MIWYGIVWYVMVWYSIVRCSKVWCSILPQDKVHVNLDYVTLVWVLAD